MELHGEPCSQREGEHRNISAQNELIAKNDSLIPAVALNRWLNNGLTPEDQVTYPGLPSGERCYPDAWQRPLIAVRDHKLNDGRNVPLGIYSLGEDGASNSEGQDADDISSWDENAGDFYRRREKWYAFLMFILLAVPTAVGIYALITTVKDRLRHPQRVP
ncbi:MAG: hypothetical protein QM775_02920 [Pirellulales bacterium]